MEQIWHYALNGKQHGPVSASELKQLVARGKLQPTDLVWREGMAKWVVAQSVNGLLPSAGTSSRAPTSVTPVFSKQPRPVKPASSVSKGKAKTGRGKPALSSRLQAFWARSSTLVKVGVGGGLAALLFLVLAIGLMSKGRESSEQGVEDAKTDVEPAANASAGAELKSTQPTESSTPAELTPAEAGEVSAAPGDMWLIEQPTTIVRWQTDSDPVLSLCFSANGKELLVGGRVTFKRFRAETGTEVPMAGTVFVNRVAGAAAIDLDLEPVLVEDATLGENLNRIIEEGLTWPRSSPGSMSILGISISMCPRAGRPVVNRPWCRPRCGKRGDRPERGDGRQCPGSRSEFTTSSYAAA